ncbi:MAG: peptidoglycan DD-metalloendopeptidase family protein, partial [Balneolaceae bacterium]
MFKTKFYQGLTGLAVVIFLSTCTLFESKEVTPAVSLENFEEIKELPVLDAYGYDRVLENVTEGEVKRNESLYIILRSLDVSPQKIHEIEREARGKLRLNRIQPGQRYLTYADGSDKEPHRMILHSNLLEYVVLDWEDDIIIEKGTKEITTRVSEASGVITSSLYETLQENGVNPLLGNKLSEIFGWQIDFFRLYKNDSFKVVYEQEFVDGQPYGVGKVIAAEFEHKGTSFDAYFFETEDRAGYFDSNGKGVQKALLKAPFTFSQRISSNFSHSRFHPVLKRRMPHYGVDYAAPLGTPVISVGDGEVIESRYRGPNGNIVKIKHNGTYTTAYLHLNGFASGIKKGVKVKQGQVIGYVGRTGRVTGVHLDYRIYKNDQPVNPVTVKLPPSKSISDKDMASFKAMVDKYRFQL